MLTNQNVKEIAELVDQELKHLMLPHVPPGYAATVVESHLQRILTDHAVEQLRQTIANLLNPDMWNLPPNIENPSSTG